MMKPEELQKWIGEFGKSMKWNYAPGVIEHLKEEVVELEESKWLLGGYDRGEIADCCILLFVLAYTLDFDLLKAVEKKQRINMSRTWLPPDKEGVVRHDKSAAKTS